MIAVGQRWRNGRNGRVMVILQVDYRGTGPAWHYEGEAPGDWHYSCVQDFTTWGTYALIPEGYEERASERRMSTR
jgi:hypothetical protein